MNEYKEIIDKVTKVQSSLYKHDLMNYATLQNKDRNHFHVHLIPRYKNYNLDTWPKTGYKEDNFPEVYREIKDLFSRII